MHINPTFYTDPTLVGWLLVIGIAFALLAFFCLVIWFACQVEDGDASLGLFLVGIAAVPVAVLSIIFFFIGLDNNNDRWYGALEQQAKQYYGVDINRSQANDLLDPDYPDTQQQGSTYVLLPSSSAANRKPVQVSLYHIGDTWILGTGVSADNVRELTPIAR